MPVWGWVALAVAAIVVVLVVALGLQRARRRSAERSRLLADRFGPEYDRTLREAGDKREAERELERREEAHATLDIRPLPLERVDAYREEWLQAQQRFVDYPAAAVADADRLVTACLAERGYPTGDLEQRTSMLSVEHAHVLDDYRRAHAIAEASRLGQAETEDLRQAMVHYRSLFDSLLGDGESTVGQVYPDESGTVGATGPATAEAPTAPARTAPDSAPTQGPAATPGPAPTAGPSPVRRRAGGA
jgi:hypothetical protein